MQPAKARGMDTVVDGIVAFAMVFEAPSARPYIRVVRRQEAALASSGHDFVLAKGKGIDIAHRPDGPPLVSGAVCLSAVFDYPKPPLTREFENRIHVTRPAR